MSVIPNGAALPTVCIGQPRLAGFYNDREIIIPLPRGHKLTETNLQHLVEVFAHLRDQMIDA